MQKTVTLKKIRHRESDRIGIFFDYNNEIKALVMYAGALYSKTNRCFHLPYTRASLQGLLKELKGVTKVDMEDLYIQEGKKQTASTPAVKAPKKRETGPTKKLKGLVPEEFLKILKRRRYSANTVKTYGNFLNQYLNFIAPKSGGDSDDEDVKRFMYYLVRKRKVATSTQNQAVNAIKFYFEHYLGREKKNFYIERPIKEKRLPRVLSEEEIIKMIVAAGNLKHQCIIAMLYSAGLRRGELLNLRKEDISFDRQQVYIRAGKGKKDRVSVLSERMAIALQKYLAGYKPAYWLFEGPEKKQFSATSIGNIVKKASMKIGLNGITPHMLRHSFATHMMDRGTDTRVIQTLLGHERLETTAIYTHVSRKDFQKIKSPLDQIFESNTLDSNTLIN